MPRKDYNYTVDKELVTPLLAGAALTNLTIAWVAANGQHLLSKMLRDKHFLFPLIKKS